MKAFLYVSMGTWMTVGKSEGQVATSGSSLAFCLDWNRVFCCCFFHQGFQAGSMDYLVSNPSHDQNDEVTDMGYHDDFYKGSEHQTNVLTSDICIRVGTQKFILSASGFSHIPPYLLYSIPPILLYNAHIIYYTMPLHYDIISLFITIQRCPILLSIAPYITIQCPPINIQCSPY